MVLVIQLGELLQQGGGGADKHEVPSSRKTLSQTWMQQKTAVFSMVLITEDS